MSHSHRNEPARERRRKKLKQNYSLSSLPLDDRKGIRLTLENHFGWHVMQKCHVGDGRPQVIQFLEKPNKKGTEFQKVTYVMYVKGKEDGIGVDRPEKETQTGPRQETDRIPSIKHGDSKDITPDQKDKLKRIATEVPPPGGQTLVIEPYGPDAYKNLEPYLDYLPSEKKVVFDIPKYDDTVKPVSKSDEKPKREVSPPPPRDESKDRDESPGRKKKKFIHEFYYKSRRDRSRDWSQPEPDDKIGAAPPPKQRSNVPLDEMKDIDGQKVKGNDPNSESKRVLPKKWQLRAGTEYYESDLEMVRNYMEYSDNYYMMKENEKKKAEGELSLDSSSNADDILCILQNRSRRISDAR